MKEWVVDRNMIRRSDFSPYKSNPDARFILTDTLFVEAVKNSDGWRETLRRDLEALMPVRARTRMAVSVSEALRIEIDTGRAITREGWFSSDLQMVLDHLFDATSNGGEQYVREMAKIEESLEDLKAEQPPTTGPKSQTEKIVGKLRRCLGEDGLSDLRAGRLSGDAKLWLIDHIAYEAYNADCEARGHAPLLWPGSISARFFILKSWRGIRWLQNSGLDNAKEQSLHNDHYDDEYILVGSFFDGTLTNEQRVKEADTDLMRIVSVGSGEDLAAAFQRYRAQKLQS